MRDDYYPQKDSLSAIAERHESLATRAGSIYQAHNGLMSTWGNQLVVLLFFHSLLASCAPNAQIVNETATGGTVLYPYIEEQDVLTSPERQDALRLLEEKCPVRLPHFS